MRKINLRFVAASLYIAIASILFCAPVFAQQENARYKLYIGGIPAGELVFSANNNGNSYQVVGNVRSTGLIGSLVKVGYEAQSRGTVRNGDLYPQSYSEKANTGRRKQSSKMSYKNGVPP